MNIDFPKANFKLYDMVGLSLEMARRIMDEKLANIKNEEPGFSGAFVLDESIQVKYSEIVEKQVDSLEDGEVKLVSFFQVENCTIYMNFKHHFVAAFGKQSAIKTVETLFKLSPITVSAEKLFTISEQMAYIKMIELDKAAGPTIKKARFVGRIESAADLAPLNDYFNYIKSVQGTITGLGNTVTIVKVDKQGKFSLKYKNQTELGIDSDVIDWAYFLIKRKGAKEIVKDFIDTSKAAGVTSITIKTAEKEAGVDF